MNVAPRPNPTVWRPVGFTLAEVLFSMAIFTFAALMLVGVLPNGMASLQSARRDAAEVRMFAHLRAVYQAELDRVTATELTATLNRMRQPAYFYFDDRGDPVRSVANTELETRFGVQCVLEPALLLPGESDPSPFQQRLRMLVTEQWRNAVAYTDPNRHRQRVVTLVVTTPLETVLPTPNPAASTANTNAP